MTADGEETKPTSLIATLAIAVLALALAVGARSIAIAGAALSAAGVVAGLAIASDGATARLVAGSTIASLSILFALGGGAIAVVSGSVAPWLGIVLVGVWLAVFCAGAIARVSINWSTLRRPVGTTIVGGIGLLIGGTLLSVLGTQVDATIAFVAGLLGLGDQPLALSALLSMLALAIGSVAVGLRLLPTVALLGLDATAEEVESLDALYKLLLAAAVIVLALVLVEPLVLAIFGPPAATVIEIVAANTPLRVLLLSVLLVGCCASIAGIVLRWAWSLDEETLRTRGVVVVAGAIATVVGLVGAVIVGASDPLAGPSVGAGGGRAMILGALGCAVAVLAFLCRPLYDDLPLARGLPDGIILGGLASAVAVSVGTDAVVSPLIAVGATLVAWDVGTYGRTLTAELSDDVPIADTAFVHASGSIAVGVAGVVVATVTTVGLQWLGPALARRVSIAGLAVGAMLAVGGATLLTVGSRSNGE